MSCAAEVLAELRANHCVVQAYGDRLRIRGPVSRLSDDLRARVAAAKAELLRLLAPTSAPGQGLAVREVLGLRGEWLAGLPLPPVLVLVVPDVVYIDLRERPRPGAFGAAEWLAMVRAAELGRARASDLREWVQRKRCEPWFRVSEVEAAGGHIRGARQPMTAAQVLSEYGAELRAVVIEATRERPSTISALEASTAHPRGQDGSVERKQAESPWVLTPDEARAHHDPPGHTGETVDQ